MSYRGRKRKGGRFDEWDDSHSPTTLPTPGVKHTEQHLEITGDSSSIGHVHLGPSPTKPRRSLKRTQNLSSDSESDLEDGWSETAGSRYAQDDGCSIPDTNCGESEGEEDVSDEYDNPPDPDLAALPSIQEEAIPDLDSSPYDDLWDDDGIPQKSNEEGNGGSKRPRKEAQLNPLSAFVGMIDTFVDELLRLEAPEPTRKQRQCNSCAKVLADEHFRCRDCPSTAIWCKDCVVGEHAKSALHRLERWNGQFYDRLSLKTLGLRVQLGHTHGTTCEHPESGPTDFIVIDSDGIHNVAIDYCGCHQKGTHVEQLLRARLFPSSCESPRTAGTFRVLETFQMLSFTAKTSAFEFLAAIRRRTDNVEVVNDRYREFLRMVHMWRHVRLLKRTGRGHDPEGVKNTKPGECAVLCPACPQVGINLPDNWRDSSMLWIYALFLAIDANFRLKRKDVSSDDKDPGLNHGYAYIVAEGPFRQHLAEHGDSIQDDKSTCNNHDAIKSASIRGGKGVAATGLGTCQCSRHDMKRPQGSGDLQKGEKYLNMDYFFIATLAFFIPFLLVVSYDIACQWSKNLKLRCSKYRSNPVKNGEVEMKFNIPKFHLAAHVQVCRDNYNFNYTPHVGRTDGEAPERGWALSNDLSFSTQEMGAGTRRDTLDDAYGDINWWKSMMICLLLADRATEAIKNRLEQVTAFEDFAGGIDDKLVKEWTAKVQKWEADPSLENPFESSGDEITEASVRTEMADEDTEAISKGKYKELRSDITPSQFILQGVELEESIRKHLIAVKALGPATRSVDRSRLIQAGNMLKRRFDSWEETQRVFMPTVLSYRQNGDGDVGSAPGAATQVKDIRLLLPSQIVNVDGVSVSLKLARYEFRIRVAQGHSAIRELRGLLLWRSQRIISKQKYSSGTSMMTRSNTLIQEISDKIRNMAVKYRGIRDKLVVLGEVLGETEWAKALKVLKNHHLRSLTTFDVGYGDGKRKLAWIWNLDTSGGTASAAVQNALRIEFCRARARAHRWQEECILLREEMRRVEQFWVHGVKTWTQRAELYEKLAKERRPPSAAIAAFPKLVEDEHEQRVGSFYGKTAYARRQAALRQKLRERAVRSHAHLVGPLIQMDRGNGEVVDGNIMIEGKGVIVTEQKKKAKAKHGKRR